MAVEEPSHVQGRLWSPLRRWRPHHGVDYYYLFVLIFFLIFWTPFFFRYNWYFISIKLKKWWKYNRTDLIDNIQDAIIYLTNWRYIVLLLLLLLLFIRNVFGEMLYAPFLWISLGYFHRENIMLCTDHSSFPSRCLGTTLILLFPSNFVWGVIPALPKMRNGKKSSHTQHSHSHKIH
jgi:hypothetical protein